MMTGQKGKKAMINTGRITVGTRFVGNVNGSEMVVVGLQHSERNQSDVVLIKDSESQRTFHYGLEALLHCDITIID